MTCTSYEDDSSIRDDCELLRRIPIKFGLHVIWDDNQNRSRPFSASFKDHSNGTPMSVVLKDELEFAERKPEEVLADHENLSLAAVTASIARENQQHVARDPSQMNRLMDWSLEKRKKPARIWPNQLNG